MMAYTAGLATYWHLSGTSGDVSDATKTASSFMDSNPILQILIASGILSAFICGAALAALYFANEVLAFMPTRKRARSAQKGVIDNPVRGEVLQQQKVA